VWSDYNENTVLVISILVFHTKKEATLNSQSCATLSLQEPVKKYMHFQGMSSDHAYCRKLQKGWELDTAAVAHYREESLLYVYRKINNW